MASTTFVDEFMTPLLVGHRTTCRRFVQRKIDEFESIERVYHELMWPAMERVEKLYRADRINTATEHMATRINRCIADQLQLSLPTAPANGKRIVIACANDEPEELGGQMCADLFESRGWEVFYLGGGVPNDEILTLLGQLRPDMLLVFGTRPQGVPSVRQLVDMIREINVNPTMNIMVSGGVFNRADGLWKEVNADIFAKSAAEALDTAETATPRVAPPPKASGVKKRRRRRRAPELATAEAS